VRFLPQAIPDVVIVEPEVHRDGRGFFLETFHAEWFAAVGLPSAFVQDNLSRSVRGTIRGLHAQRARPQGKLVRVVAGEILDVAVDVRPRSPTFLRHVAVVLSAENARAMWIPVGFLHGFSVLSETADVEYKVTDVYDPTNEIRIRYDDPRLGIDWRVASPIVSPKDLSAPRLSDRDVAPIGGEDGYFPTGL
jgi:dTDP-4-dehydrorhamnose 3,5-epimerase